MRHHLPARDSKVWLFGVVSAVITAVLANTDLYPGLLPDQTRHMLSLAAVIVGAISGTMATSPQLSKREQRKAREIDRAVRIVRRGPRKPPHGSTGE